MQPEALKTLNGDNSLAAVKIVADSLHQPPLMSHPTQYEFLAAERNPGFVRIEDDLFISNAANANDERVLK